MTIIYLILLVVVACVNRWLINYFMAREAVYLSRMIATMTTVLAFVLVYFIIKSMMPWLINVMDTFYRQ